MATVAELQTQLQEMRNALAKDEREVQWGERRVVYRTTGEIQAVIADLERQLAAATGTRIHTVRFGASKGLD